MAACPSQFMGAPLSHHPKIIKIDFYNAFNIQRCDLRISARDEYILTTSNGIKEIISHQNKYDIEKAYSMYLTGKSPHHVIQLMLSDPNPFGGQYKDETDHHLRRNSEEKERLSIVKEQLEFSKRKKLLLL